MKKFTLFFGFIVVFLMACQKNSLEIELKATHHSNPLLGAWGGKLYCSACCNSEYQLNLEINENNLNGNNQSFTTRLTITSVKDNQLIGYAVYQVPTSYENGILKLQGGNIIESQRYDGGKCSFCEQNFFTLRQVSATRFEGVWDSSSSCSRMLVGNSTVIIEKK